MKLRSAVWVLLGLAACGGPQGTEPQGAPAPAPAERKAQSAATPAQLVDRIAANLWEARLRRWPRTATQRGYHQYGHLLEDLSEPAREAWREQTTAWELELATIDPSALDQERRITLAVMRAALRTERQLDICARHRWAIDQLAGLQVSLPNLGRSQPVDTLERSAAYLQRLAGVQALVSQHLDNLRAGLKSGPRAHGGTVERVLAQLDAALAQPLEESPYLEAANRAAALGSTEQDRFRREIAVIVERGVRPAFARYRDFLRNEYLPRARTEAGIGQERNGAACYRATAEYHTTTQLTPQEIHERGLAELERLHGEMNALAERQGHAHWRAYLATLEQDPAQHLATEQALVEHNQALVAKAQAALPRAFGRIPSQDVRVTPLEAYRAADAPAAYYYAAPDDGSRPALYYINTHLPHTRPLYNMEALAYHEAVPGHHLQIAIAQQLEGLPEIRRHARFTAFVEGWALYAELVAAELGLYASPATTLGMYNYQAWRAARLVVDTGMHAMGWSRQQAIDFMSTNLAFPQEEIVNEVDRYILWPGQALAYMVGRMELQSIRQEAEAALGSAFNLRAFHDELLGHGALPLSVLRDVMRAWTSRQGGGGEAAAP